jgi:hypothetical protein
MRHLLQGVFIASESPAIHEDIEPWVFAFHDNVQSGAHRLQFIASPPDQTPQQ